MERAAAYLPDAGSVRDNSPSDDEESIRSSTPSAALFSSAAESPEEHGAQEARGYRSFPRGKYLF